MYILLVVFITCFTCFRLLLEFMYFSYFPVLSLKLALRLLWQHVRGVAEK
jgi:hypothetical protein